ncbi:MAG: hypothetical protein P8X74_01490 [Reinekea sp.]|jgi:hypothetical protein
MFNRVSKEVLETEVTVATLTKDVNGVLSRSVKDQLTQASSMLQRKINSGLTQKDYERYKAFKASVDCSILILEKAGKKIQ